MRKVTARKQWTKERDSPKEPIVEGLAKSFLRRWSSLSNAELLEIANNLITQNDLEQKIDLSRFDRGLYTILWRRGLVDKLAFNKSQRNWASMSNDELKNFVNMFIAINQISTRTELHNKDAGLYSIARRRKILNLINFPGDERAWSKYSDEKLIEYTEKIIEKGKIKRRKDLQKTDPSLYSALLERNLVGKLNLKRTTRDWASMSDQQIVNLVLKLLQAKHITSLKELKIRDQSAYQILRNRKLFDKVGLKKGKRKWKSDSELIKHTEAFIQENNIRKRSDLFSADHALYEALRKRELLSVVFAGFEEEKNKNLETELASGLCFAALAMEKFAEGEEG